MNPDPIATLREKALAYDAMLYAKGPWKARVELAYVAAANPRTVLALLDRLAAAEAVMMAANAYISESPCDPDITNNQAAAWDFYNHAREKYQRIRAIGGGKEAGE